MLLTLITDNHAQQLKLIYSLQNNFPEGNSKSNFATGYF